MQLPVLIAATATPLTSLVNPGAVFLSERPVVVSFQANPPVDAGRLPLSGSSLPKGSQSDGVIKVQSPGAGTRALTKLRTFALWGDNWDGDGAPAPRSENLDAASLLVGFLQSSVGRTPNVGLNGDGDPIFTVMKDDFELAVTVVSKSELSYLVAYRDDERAGLATFDEQQLPADIADAIAELRLVAA